MNICRLSDILNRIVFPKDAQSKKALAVGLAVRFLEAKWGAKQVGQHLDRILPAIDANQYEFYFDSITRVVGFVTWALVTPDISRTLIQSGPSALAQSDWRCGSELWIIDFFARDGVLPETLADLRDRILHAHETATYFRYKSTRRLVKQVSRQDRTTFFSAHGGKSTRQFFAPDDKVNLTANDIILHGCEQNFSRALEIGRCMLALRHSQSYLQSPLWKSSYSLSEFVAIRQYRTYLTADGAPAGLLTWAWLSARTISNIARVPLHDTHTSEWNEGDLLCLCDVAVSESVREEMEGDILGNLFPQESTILLYSPATNDAPPQLLQVKRAQQIEVIKEWLIRASTHSVINKSHYAVSA
jgi:hemolysin-activating ACP:hemolysin acyltransferase